jgi:phosphonate transport system ATP-binding protein
MPSAVAVEICEVTKHFGKSCALDHITLSIAEGEMVALLGASGSGKSTLLRTVAGFIAADRGSGAIRIHNETVQSDGRLDRHVRRTRMQMGFVFQQFNLVNRLSVLTNVLVGSLARTPRWRKLFGRFSNDAKRKAAAALAQVGILEQAYKRAGDLSGGQQQRVAIARAMVQGAKVILADEPIASLDPESARNVMEMLARLNREDNRTVLVSLHQVAFARQFCARTVALRRGEVVYDGPSALLDAALLNSLYGGAAVELLAPLPRAAEPESQLEFETLAQVDAMAVAE